MGPAYVEMSGRNRRIILSSPVGDEKILVFDIDHCLFHNPEHRDGEYAAIKRLFMEKSCQDEGVWDYHVNVTGGLFKELFFRLLDVHPAEYTAQYEERGLPDFVTVDAELIELLGCSTYRMFCFTNSGMGRASRILKHLGIEGLFEAVICADTAETEFICKPKPEAYAFLEQALGITSKKCIHFYDDSAKNIAGAVGAGWNAYLVDGDIKALLHDHIN